MFILSKFTPFCTPPISVGHPFSEHWHLTWSASPACPYYSFYIQNCVSWDIYTLQNCSSFWFLFIICQPVGSAYQPPANRTFLSEQTSHQQPASITLLSEQTSISHQPPANRTGCAILHS
jgi:hypothetical protein